MYQFNYVKGGSYRPAGMLAEALKASTENRLRKVDYKNLVKPFRERYENEGAWRCEFWGKIMRSAIYSYRTTRDEKLKEVICASVKDLLTTQTEDGVISSTLPEGQLGIRTPGMGPFDFLPGAWDVWGRKYVLLGLIAYYQEIEPDPEVLTACRRLLDNLIEKTSKSGIQLLMCGRQGGLPACSILAGVVKMWQLTGELRYRDFAREIIDSGCAEGIDIFKAVLAGKFPKDIGTAKAYEMCACFEGLADYCCMESVPEFEEAVLKFYRMVRDREIFVNGTAGLVDEWGEFWGDGAFKQARLDNLALGETCITAAWLMFADRVLRMTGDPEVYDQMENSIYNGTIGAMRPDGVNWCHRNPTPLAAPGFKKEAWDQIGFCFQSPFDGNDCCRAQGPQGLAISPCSAVLCGPAGELLINGYEPGEIDFTSPDGVPFTIVLSGDYPRKAHTVLTFKSSAAFDCTVKLRIPAWNTNGRVLVNGEVQPGVPGTYLEINRKWQNGDEITMDFDFSLRIIPIPDDNGHFALKCGALLLAQDSRLGGVGEAVSVSDAAMLPDAGEWNMLWNVGGQLLCDYASAGNAFSEENQLCVIFQKR